MEHIANEWKITVVIPLILVHVFHLVLVTH